MNNSPNSVTILLSHCPMLKIKKENEIKTKTNTSIEKFGRRQLPLWKCYIYIKYLILFKSLYFHIEKISIYLFLLLFFICQIDLIKMNSYVN